jgi:hypothetical protein
MNLKAAIFGAGVALSLGVTGVWAGSAPQPVAAAGQAEAIFAAAAFGAWSRPSTSLMV